ncbi:hypothetical protein CVS40_12010 [Lucilia cuprina]|nr:hypothetical protein CVS40_12010 [Lucilia cuprina]
MCERSKISLKIMIISRRRLNCISRCTTSTILSARALVEDDEPAGSVDEDIYHFIGYVPIDVVSMNWMRAKLELLVRPIIEERMNKYSEGGEGPWKLMMIRETEIAKATFLVDNEGRENRKRYRIENKANHTAMEREAAKTKS